MPAVRIADLLSSADAALGTTVHINGWIRTRRDSKAGLSFLQVSDGSCFASIQVVAKNTLDNYDAEVLKLTPGASVTIEGEVVASRGKGQSIELQALRVDVIGFVDDPDTYPIQPKQHSMEYLRDVAHLRPRTNTFGALGRVRNCVSMAIHSFFQERGFCWIHTPIITANDCEGAGEMFRISTLDMMNLPRTEDGAIDYSKDFFGRESHLTVSGQLAVECWSAALTNVYTFGPTFRAENSNTSRHLAEFWMVEPEIAFADLTDNADLAEAMLKYVFRKVLDERGDDMEFFQERIDKTCITRLESFVESTFVRMEYTDAIKILKKAVAGGQTFEYPVEWGIDLQSEHERYLTEHHAKAPVILMNYPKDIKAFYMRLNDDEKTVAAMDVLAPGIGEIIGGAQREERLDVLDARLAEMNLNQSDYWWYRDLRRYGTMPHAGFGLGLERTLVYATGLHNVRDVIPFPRTPGHAEF